ncbi:MAG: hypothetical protein R2718_06475 [Solirubrobacterales bacterium]
MTVAIRIATPFDHGIWLIAYLLLVGSVAPILVVRSLEHLDASVVRRSAIEAAAWLAAVILVPAGVLVDARALVVVGSFSLLAALALITQRTPPATANRRLAHFLIIWFMAASTFVGIALAWDRPWL